MKNFKLKNNFLSNISFISMMCALIVIIVGIGRLFPLSFVFFMFIIPVVSTIESFYCSEKYFPLFFIATISLSLICNMQDMGTTLFYVLPGLLIGFVIGFLIKRNVSIYSIFAYVVILELMLNYCVIFITNSIFQIDIVSSIFTAFGLKDFKYISQLAPTSVLFLSLFQVLLALLMVVNLSKNLQITINFVQSTKKIIPLINTVLLLIAPAFIFTKYFMWLPILIFAISLISTILVIPIKQYANKNFLIFCGITFCCNLIIYVLTYEFVIIPFQILLFETTILALNLYIILLLRK